MYNSYVYYVPATNIKIYDGHICVVEYKGNTDIYRIKVLDDESLVIYSDSRDIKVKKIINASDIKILGRVVWFSHDEQGL